VGTHGRQAVRRAPARLIKRALISLIQIVELLRDGLIGAPGEDPRTGQQRRSHD
jgi:hypothetical protein